MTIAARTDSRQVPEERGEDDGRREESAGGDE